MNSKKCKTTLSEALEYLFSLRRFGIRLGLDNISCLLTRLGEPQKKLHTIHVGGTNGKGSTAASIHAMLMANDYRVGLYTSPHLKGVEERFRINDTNISKEEFLVFFNRVRNIVEQGKEITFFEYLTAMAFDYFYEKKTDWAVIEVGMGGRYDATNVIRPQVSVITNVDYEHTEYLGADLRKIAFEKAGIVKNDGILVTAIKNPEILDYIEEICDSRNAKIYALDRDFQVKIKEQTISGTRFDFSDSAEELKDLMIPLVGNYQVDNAALAVKTSFVLRELGWDMREKGIRKGLKNVCWKGRFDIIRKEPMLICDGSHNPGGIKSFIENLIRLVPYDRLFIIFGVMDDKDYVKMGEYFVPRVDELILVQPDVERALDPETVFEAFRKYEKDMVIIRNVNTALRYVLQKAGKRDVVCVIGSLYLVSEALREYETVSLASINNEENCSEAN
jgi:dihydrofolate synthase/folylpolyglutamate synthase